MTFPKLYTNFAKYYDRLESQYRDYDQDARWISETLKDAHSIVDVSCGTGNHITRLATFSDLDLYAMDVSEEMIEIASEKETLGKVQFLRSDFLNLPFRKNSFDAAICMYWSLASLDESRVRKLFDEVYLILSNDGILIFDVENSEGIKENLIGSPFIDSFFNDGTSSVIRTNISRKLKSDLVDWRAYYLIEGEGVSELFEDRMSLRFYSKCQLENLLADSGFKVENVFSGPFKEYTPNSPSLYFVARKQS